ncbi:Hypothetical predicted protein [Cloeon dipterum]|uniref:snRNA-activating protein complex subunit 3 n=4 Tax=Cloeon dipterum TaxID=197152 RepID=A0A8S1D088_9INSE|nr:Hypothetical predicted protein [Cloeon dipterum]
MSEETAAAERQKGGTSIKHIDFSTKTVDLYQYFIDYSSSILNAFGFKLPFDSKPKKLSEIIGVTGPGLEYNFHTYEKLLDAALLDVDGEIPTLKINTKGTQQPRTFQKPQQEDIENLKSLMWAETHVKEKYYTTQYHEKLWIKSNPTTRMELNVHPFGDYLIHVKVHKPCKHHTQVKKALKLTVQEDILVLSSQALTVLKDTICCPNDFSTCGDTTDTPSRNVPKFAKELFPGGFFFIEDTFYNDLRKPCTPDYSRVVREWAARNPKFPKTEFSVSNMANVVFRDLKLKIGYPYLYKHLGSCEHIITFVNAKLVNRADDLNSKHYPMRRIPMGYRANRLCIMCGFFNAVWVTVGNEFVPHDPAFFCNHCFHSYNFVNGKRICNFTTYPLIDSTKHPTKPEEKILYRPVAPAGQAHPLLYTPKNVHRELVVSNDSCYPSTSQ